MTVVMRDSAASRSFARRTWSFGRRHALAIWLAVVPLLTAVFVVRHWQEVGQIMTAIREAHPRWIAVGIGIELVTIVVSALTYRLLLRRLGHCLPCLTLAGAHVRRAALGAIFVLSGPASVYVFLRILKQWRVPTDDGLLTVALRSVAGQGAFFVVLGAALVIHGTTYGLIAAGALLAVTLLLIPAIRRNWLNWRGSVPWRHRLPRRATERATEFVARLRGHQLAWRDLGWPALLMLLNRIGPIGLLFVSLRALEVDATLSVAVTAYLAALLAHTMVPIFQGAGVVEAAAAVALKQSGVPAETAVGVALLWRLLDFWMVLGLGLAVHALASMRPVDQPVASTARPLPAPNGLAWQPVPVHPSVPPAESPSLRRR